MGEESFGDRVRTAIVPALARLGLSAPEVDEPALRPFRPSRPEEVPAAARALLGARLPDLSLDRLFVIPGWRTGTYRGRRASAPGRVLAFGTDVVACWTESDGEDALRSIPLADLIAVDDRSILLHGRLTIIGRDGRIAVPYNTVARDDIREHVLRVRGAIAGGPRPVARRFVWLRARGVEGRACDLPYKWRFVLTCGKDLRIDPDADDAVAVGDVQELRARRRRPPTGIGVLGPRELVVAAEPPEYPDEPRYGLDLTAVPRRFVRDLSWDGRELRIALEGAGPGGSPAISRRVDGWLVEAMHRSFGDAVAWA